MWPFSSKKEETIDNLTNELEFLKNELKESKQNTEELRRSYNELVSFKNSILNLLSEKEHTEPSLTPIVRDVDVLCEEGALVQKEEEKMTFEQYNKELVEAFEKALNSNNQNCRGLCFVKDPKSNERYTKKFNSRTEAEDLLEKFKNKELILVQ